MAVLDDKRDVYVVRVVYDGPPFSGKTTTLRALSSGLSRELECPEEHDGRTLYFDWLDYTAGRFEGRPIRCQVVSVPGQKSLADRRRRLLQDADAVVFVADTGALGMDLSLKYAAELRAHIRGMDTPRPGVVIQANKRDVEDALPIPEVIERCRSIGLEAALIETTASTGSGVREAFLFGVRLALDRVKELSARGLLRTGSPGIDSADELLRELTRGQPAKILNPGEQPATDSAQSARVSPAQTDAAIVGEMVRKAMAVEQASSPQQPAAPAQQAALTQQPAVLIQQRFALPDPLVPSGCIWPPIEGRIIVQQALVSKDLAVREHPSCDLYAYSPNGWRIHSRATDVFADQNSGRSALVEWARLHVRNQSLLSERRCVVLSPDQDRWRLWQIVGVRRSLEEALEAELSGTHSGKSVEVLLSAAHKLAVAADSFRAATIALTPGLATVAADSAEPRYVGLMPGFDLETDPSVAVAEMNRLDLVADRMGGLIAGYARRVGPERLISSLQTLGLSAADKEPVSRTLINVVRSRCPA